MNSKKYTLKLPSVEGYRAKTNTYTNANILIYVITLPDSVADPSSLMTCAWGLSVFITSSSDNRSFLSDSGALAENYQEQQLPCL